MENVLALVGDNANGNQAIARKKRPFYVGVDSHRFSLSVNNILATFDTTLEKVNFVIKKTSFLNSAAKLCKLTLLRLKLHNDTRRSSKFSMLDRYRKLRSFLL